MQPTIYIPNFNGSARLSRLLESLVPQAEGCRVVLVDNGSADDSVAMTRARFHAVAIVELKRNIGFGRALNRAIAEQPGDPLILVNNDVICEPGFVAAMLAELRPGIDMVAGVLVQEQAPNLVDSAGIVADRRTLMAFDHLSGLPLAALEGAVAPMAPCGGAALYRRTAFEAAGGFDERIFLYYEDLDLGLRLRELGAECGFARQARARHAYSATLGDQPAAKYALTGWSRGYLLRRYGVMRQPARATRTLLCEATICAGQLILDRTASGLAGRLRGWRDAGGLSPRPLPGGLIELPLRTSLARRLRRQPQSRAPAAEKLA